MGLIQNQNMTRGFSSTEVTYWESTTHPLSAANCVIVVLGVLTFALQLCLVLLFMLRCWRFDSRVKEALRQPDSVKKLSELPYIFPGAYKQPTYFLCQEAAEAPPPPASTWDTEDRYEPSASSPFAPFIPWDLVQSGPALGF